MTATNHVLTGAVIGSVISNPLIALPLAFLSHFVVDALPHYGERGLQYRSSKFKMILAADIYIAAMILILVLFAGGTSPWLVMACGMLAASPDLMWMPDFVAALERRKKPIYGRIRQFHSKIQWYQKPKGIYVEAVWFFVFFMIAFSFTI